MRNSLYIFIIALLSMSSITVATQAAEIVYNTNFALASNGASATASTSNGENTADKAIDGKTTGTRWESVHGVDPQTWTLDMGQERIFLDIQITWENAYSKTFTLEYSHDGADWTLFHSVGPRSLRGLTELIRLDEAITARYIRFTGTERATTYGHSFFEFSVMYPGAAKMEAWPTNAVLSPLPQQVRVLSLNNSLIDYNDQYLLFNNIATAMGKDATWTKHTNLGQNLDYHYDSDPVRPTAREEIASTAYTHIVLQEQSSRPLTDFAAFRASVKRWVEYIRTSGKNPQAVIILAVNWAYNTENEDTYRANNRTLMANYRAVAQEFGLVLCPLADAYQRAVDDDAAYKNSLYTDNRHPSLAASYMAACAEYGVIFGESPATITQKPAGLADNVASAVRGFAAMANIACEQVIDHKAGTVRYEVHQLDGYGETLRVITDATYSATGGTMTGSVFACTTQGEYTITATTEGQSCTTKVYVDRHPQTSSEEDEKEQQDIPEDAIRLSYEQSTYTETFDAKAGDAVLAVTESDLASAGAGTANAGKRSHELAVALPAGWRIRTSTTPTNVGVYETGEQATTFVGGTLLPNNGRNGTWNFGRLGDTDRAIGGVTTGASGGATCINVMVCLANADELHTIDSLTITYDVEKYRRGTNGAGYTFDMRRSETGLGGSWTQCGAPFVTVYEKDATFLAATDADLPLHTTSVSGVLHESIAPGRALYLDWHCAVTSGSTYSNAQAYALDNVTITAHYSDTATDCHALTAASAATKRLLDGHLYILRDERMYNAHGARVR